MRMITMIEVQQTLASPFLAANVSAKQVDVGV